MTALVLDANKNLLGVYVKALVFVNPGALLLLALSADAKPGTVAATLQP